MPRRYLIRYMDPATGFIKREEFDHHRDMTARVIELQVAGAKDIKTQPLVVGRAGGP